MRKLALLLGMGALTACAERTVYLRTDEQDIAANSALRQQFELDRITCQTEAGDTRDCMAVKGYVSVAKDQAAAKQQQLAAIAAQNAAPETVSGLPPFYGRQHRPKASRIRSRNQSRLRPRRRKTDSG